MLKLYSIISSSDQSLLLVSMRKSCIKQIDRRLQISGAQWNAENVPQVLAHRTAYINDLFSLKR